MRTVLVICVVSFVLMLASLQADAKRFVLNERHLDQVKNDPNLGRSPEVFASGGGKAESQSQTTNKVSSNSEAQNDNHDTDDANETHGKYRDDSESESHRYFQNDKFTGPNY